MFSAEPNRLLLLLRLNRLVLASELLAELLDAAHRVDKLLLAGEEWVRSRRDVNVKRWISVAVFPNDRVFGVYGRAS